jgi:hypothetical protein
MKTSTNIIYPTLAAFALACFSLSPTLRAVDPPPDGGYPGRNTAEGDDALFSLTSGTDNTAIGFNALYSDTTGTANTATGVWALLSNIGGAFNTANGTNAMISNDNGGFNAAFGSQALFSNTSGSFNTAVGWNALYSNQVDNNTAVGAFALTNNTTGGFNVAVGYCALCNNIEGINNSAFGWGALANTTGSHNTATGVFALIGNTTGEFNTATGAGALAGPNGSGFANTATGAGALTSNTDGGDWNTATGTDALVFNTTGRENTATGAGALHENTTGSYNAASGDGALTFSTGNLNIAVGYLAGSNLASGNNNLDIGNLGVVSESNTIRIGTVTPATDFLGVTHPKHTATYVAGIMGKTIPRGVPVFINANGQLGTATSSARFKHEIKPMDKASEAILALKPVTFRYKKDIDPDGIPQFGLVAEDVEKVNPDLVARDADGKVYTVRYEAVNAMLLNEFLKEHRKNEEQKRTIAEVKSNAARQEATIALQQQEIQALSANLKEQAALILKVNDKVELNRPAPQTVADDHR